MIECDAFKLIEELIKNTTDTNNRLLMQTKLHDSNNQSSLDDNTFKQTSDTTQPLDQLYLNLNFSTKSDEIYSTPPISMNDLKIEIQSNKPNRPYSYYIATNYHPLDLSLINEDITETEPVCKKVTKRVRKKQLNNKSKRLSTSLGDMTINCTDLTMTANNNTTHNTPVTKKKVRSLSKDKDFEIVDEFTDDTNNFLNRRRGVLSSDNQNVKLTNQYSSTRRLNKFLRSIFRLDSEPIEQIEEPVNESRFKSKINRFFSSFRTTSNVTKKKKTEQLDLLIIETPIHTDLLVMDEPTQLMLPEIKLEISLPELNFKKELCYSEIEDRLKQLTNLSNASDLLSKSSDTTGYESACNSSFSKKNDKSASCSPLSSPLSMMSSSAGSFQIKSLDFDIPFIDEDSESVYDFKEQDEDLNIKSTLTSASASTSSTETSSNDNNLNYVTDNVIGDYLKHLNYDTLDTIMNGYLSKSEWSNIVLVFDLTNRAIQMLNQYSDNIEIVKLKEICAKYINNKYYDFINQNGGLESLAKNEMRNRSNERIH